LASQVIQGRVQGEIISIFTFFERDPAMYGAIQFFVDGLKQNFTFV